MKRLVTFGAPASAGCRPCWHAGLWGLGRSARIELPALPLCCVGVDSPGAQELAALASLLSGGQLKYDSGGVRGLQVSATIEPEVRVCGARHSVPRLVSRAPLLLQRGCRDADIEPRRPTPTITSASLR